MANTIVTCTDGWLAFAPLLLLLFFSPFYLLATGDAGNGALEENLNSCFAPLKDISIVPSLFSSQHSSLLLLLRLLACYEVSPIFDERDSLCILSFDPFSFLSCISSVLLTVRVCGELWGEEVKYIFRWWKRTEVGFWGMSLFCSPEIGNCSTPTYLCLFLR